MPMVYCKRLRYIRSIEKRNRLNSERDRMLVFEERKRVWIKYFCTSFYFRSCSVLSASYKNSHRSAKSWTSQNERDSSSEIKSALQASSAESFEWRKFRGLRNLAKFRTRVPRINITGHCFTNNCKQILIILGPPYLTLKAPSFLRRIEKSCFPSKLKQDWNPDRSRVNRRLKHKILHFCCWSNPIAHVSLARYHWWILKIPIVY